MKGKMKPNAELWASQAAPAIQFWFLPPPWSKPPSPVTWKPAIVSRPLSLLHPCPLHNLPTWQPEGSKV